MIGDSDKKIVVLISGNGSNLQAIIDACASTNEKRIPASIAAVISNRPDVRGLQRAALAGIPALTLDHKNFGSREHFDQELVALIDKYEPDVVVLAGFMRILTETFVSHYLGKLLNIHPSLLPKYPGLNTHQRAIDAGDTEAGSTVHFVTAELDGGPAIMQAQTAIIAGESAEDLAGRVLQLEHQIYPAAISLLCSDRLSYSEGLALLDGEILPPKGLQYNETSSTL